MPTAAARSLVEEPAPGRAALGLPGLSLLSASTGREAGKATDTLGCRGWVVREAAGVAARVSGGSAGRAAVPGKPGGGGGSARAEGQSRRGAAIASLCLRDISHPNLDHVGLRRGGRAGAAAILPEPEARSPVLARPPRGCGAPRRLGSGLAQRGRSGGASPAPPSPLLLHLSSPPPSRVGQEDAGGKRARLGFSSPRRRRAAPRSILSPARSRNSSSGSRTPPPFSSSTSSPPCIAPPAAVPAAAAGPGAAPVPSARRPPGRCGLLPSGRAGAGAEAASRAGEAAPAMAL